jgi:hypothetical protein
MAAGLGFKTFTTGEVLTAADTNGYLMQGVLVFASAAARDAAITSPQEGQCCYLKDTDAVLTYSGAAWVGFDDSNAIQNAIVDSKGDLIGATAADTPARLAVGTNGQVLTADSTAATGLAWATASAGSSQVAGKNAIINGDFLINQRAFTSNTTTGAYNFDRWLQQNSGGTFTVTPQTFTPGAAPIATYEGRKYLQGITASQSAAGHYAIVTQRIEDVTRYAGTTVTISFFAKADTGTPKIGVELWQDYGSGGSPSTAATVAQSSVTLTTSWARYSVSVAVPSLTGKTLGTTANTSYLELNLWTSAGSTYNTRASSIGIQNFTASIWGVQVEYASSATYFTTATGTLQGELAACQRYYQRKTAVGNATVFGMGQASSTTQAYYSIPIPVSFRVAPSVAHSSAVGWTSTTGSAGGTIATFQTSADSVSLQVTGGSGLVAGNASALVGTSGSAYLELSAEL